MNDEPTLYQRIRQIQYKLESRYKEKGIKTEYRENWQGDTELFFMRNGQWFSSSAVVKLTLALQLPDTSYKKVENKLQKDKINV